MPEVRERKVMTVWPGIGAFGPGRWVGQMAGVRLGYGFFTFGKVLAVAMIPIALAVYAWRLLPGVCRRYTLTSRRVMVQLGLSAKDGPSLDLHGFDVIEVVVLPGQDFLHSGDLAFKREGKEVFRLHGVSRPGVFRRVCLKARNAIPAAHLRQGVEVPG
jgi:hypothetical protein